MKGWSDSKTVLVPLASTRSFHSPLSTATGVPGTGGSAVTTVPSAPPKIRQ